MPHIRLFVIMLAAALAAPAADAPLPELRIEARSGGSVMFVRNVAMQPLAAFLIELVDYPGSSYSYWEDVPDRSLAPGATKEISITNMTIGAVPEYVKVRAAVYADGSTAGVPERIQFVLDHRRTSLETTRELIRRIEKAGDADAAKADLKKWSDSLPPMTRSNRNQPAAINAATARSVIADALKKLESGDVRTVLRSLRESERAQTALKPAM